MPHHFQTGMVVSDTFALPGTGSAYSAGFGQAAYDMRGVADWVGRIQEIASSDAAKKIIEIGKTYGPEIAQRVAGDVEANPELAAEGFRIAEGSGGYTYMQEADGAVTILKAPAAANIGKKFISGASWDAITAEIGPFPALAPEESGIFNTGFQLPTEIPDFRQTDDESRRKQAEFAVKAIGAGASAAATIATAVAAGGGGAAAAAGTATGAGVLGTLVATLPAQMSVPVVGWITAAGTALVISGIAIAKGVKNKRSGKKIIAAAKKMGMDTKSAKQVPIFVGRVVKMSDARRQRVGKRLMKALDREQNKPKIMTLLRSEKRVQAKLAVLAGAVLLTEAAKAEGLAALGYGGTYVPPPHRHNDAFGPVPASAHHPPFAPPSQPVHQVPGYPHIALRYGAMDYYARPTAWIGAPAPVGGGLFPFVQMMAEEKD